MVITPRTICCSNKCKSFLLDAVKSANTKETAGSDCCSCVMTGPAGKPSSTMKIRWLKTTADSLESVPLSEPYELSKIRNNPETDAWRCACFCDHDCAQAWKTVWSTFEGCKEQLHCSKNQYHHNSIYNKKAHFKKNCGNLQQFTSKLNVQD